MTLLYARAIVPSDPGERFFIYPNSTPRFCRFCLNTETPLRFKKDAHVVPEALGNHYLLSADECDRCNETGSALEDDLTKHLAVDRAMARIAGKEGAIKHRFGKRPSFMTSEPDKDLVLVSHTEGDDSLRTKRIPDGIAYSVRVPAFRPMNVIRALARLAVFVAPASELTALDHIRRWIRREVEWCPAHFYQGHVPGPGMRKVWIELRRIGDSAAGPDYRLALGYGSKILVLDLPRADWATPVVALPQQKTPYPPYDLQWHRCVVNGEAPVRERWDMIGLAVPALKGVPCPTEEQIRVAAYFRWLADGAHDGRDLQYWLDGEQDEAARQTQELLGPMPEHVLRKFEPK